MLSSFYFSVNLPRAGVSFMQLINKITKDKSQ